MQVQSTFPFCSTKRDFRSGIKLLIFYIQFYYLPFYFFHVISISLLYVREIFNHDFLSLSSLIIIYTIIILFASFTLHISWRVIYSAPAFFTIYCFLRYKDKSFFFFHLYASLKMKTYKTVEKT